MHHIAAHQLYVAAGLLHHHGLYQVHIFGDSVLGSVNADDRVKGFYFRADRCVNACAGGAAERGQRSAQQHHGKEHENPCPAHNPGNGAYKSACGPDCDSGKLFGGGARGFCGMACPLGKLFLAVEFHFPGGTLHQGLASAFSPAGNRFPLGDISRPWPAGPFFKSAGFEYGSAKEDDDDFQSPLDLLFEALEEEQPEHIAVRQYKIFKQAAGKTAKSILVQAAVRLSAFTLPEVQRITSRDDMELDKLGSRKQAVFCVIPDSNDASLNFLVGMLYTQAFQELYYQADRNYGGSLPIPVRLMFDEFANIALPDGYARLQATMRSRNIMATIILQNISQLKGLFKDDWEGIIGNADAFCYLGGNEKSTHKYISELLGKETISTSTHSQSKGKNGSFSKNFQQSGRELMTPDEVRMLDNSKALVLLRGELPVLDQKYDLMKHPNLSLTEDGGAAPYIHYPASPYAEEDLNFTFTSLDEIEIIEDMEESE